MVDVVISREAADAIRGASEKEFNAFDVKVLPDGQRLVQLDEHTMHRLALFRLPGESLSDALIRLVALAKSQGKPN